MLAIGTGPGPEKLDAALPYAEAHDWIYTTVGIHPHDAKDVTPQHLDTLATLAEHPKVIAWGEIGLDYYYDHSPRDVQERVFRDQMALAHAGKAPHHHPLPRCLGAIACRVLEDAWKPTGLGGILHCFSSTSKTPSAASTWAFSSPLPGTAPIRRRRTFATLRKICPLEHFD